MNKVFFFALMLIFFNCNKKVEEIKETTPNVAQKKSTPKKLKIEMEYKSDQKDKLQMVFAQIELDNDQEGLYILNQNILASTEMEVEEFVMFGDYIPLIAQLKLGTKPKKMVINKIIVSYYESKVLVNGEDLDKYFVLNDFVSFDAATKTLTTKLINGKHLPHITLKRNFINRLFDLQ